MPTLPGNDHQQAPQPRQQGLQRPQHVRSLSYQVPHSQQQISPLSTSDEQQRSSMPPSPKARHAQQNRPMYMPAVLRPNSDFTQGLKRASTTQSSPSSRRNSNSSTFMNVPGLGAIQRLSRRSTGDSDKSIKGGWDLDLFPTVTDLPTKKHWKVSKRLRPRGSYSHSLLTLHRSLTPSRPSVTTSSASAPSITLFAVTIAAVAVTSSATRTPATRFLLTRTPTTTPVLSPRVPAHTVSMSSRLGIPATTARRPALRLLMTRTPRRQLR